jgi:hypothetical protein
MSVENLTLSQRHARLLVTRLQQQICARSASFTSTSIPEFINDVSIHTDCSVEQAFLNSCHKPISCFPTN